MTIINAIQETQITTIARETEAKVNKDDNATIITIKNTRIGPGGAGPPITRKTGEEIILTRQIRITTQIIETLQLLVVKIATREQEITVQISITGSQIININHIHK